MNSSLSLAKLALDSAVKLEVCAMRALEIRTQAATGKSCMVFDSSRIKKTRSTWFALLTLGSYNVSKFSRRLTMRRLLCLVLILFAAVLGKAQSQSGSATPPYKNPTLPAEERVQDLLGRMTLPEKVAMLS